MVDFYGSTIVGIAFADVVATVLIGAGRVIMPVHVGHPSFPYSRSCSLCRLGIVPSGSGVAPKSWRLLLVV